MLTFKSFLKEAAQLTPRELVKPNRARGGNNKLRIDILRDEILQNNELELAAGGKVIVTDIEAALQEIEKFKTNNTPFQLMTNKGPISSSQLAKSKVFGGGVGGAGSGTVDTAINEATQAVWLQAMLDAGSNNPLEYFTDEILKAAYRKVKANTKLNDILAISDAWKVSAYYSAKILIDSGFAQKNVVIHHGSPLMKGIYAAKNQALKNQGRPKISDDKWNPGDIWLADPSFKLSDLPTDSIQSLNDVIKELYTQRKLVGVSLKFTDSKAKITEHNIGTPPNVFRFQNYYLESNRGTYWSSKNGSIEFDGTFRGILDVSPNTSFGTLKAEVLGSKARAGSIGWTHLMDYSSRILRKTLPNNTELRADAKKIAAGDKRAIDAYFNIASPFLRGTSRQEFENQLKLKDEVWIHAKYSATILGHTITSVGGKAADEFMTSIVNYASAAMAESSVYVKVS